MHSLASAVGVKILVVDDSIDGADAMVLLLRTMGHAAVAVYDSSRAVAAARDFQADVVLLDLAMPGLDGLALARCLRKDPTTSHLRLIAVSGHAYPRHIQACRSAGIDLHLAKPVEADVLLAAIGEHHRGSPPGSELGPRSLSADPVPPPAVVPRAARGRARSEAVRRVR